MTTDSPLDGVDEWLWRSGREEKTEEEGEEERRSKRGLMSVAEMLISSVLMSLCVLLTTLGNVFVILSVFTYPPLKSVQNFFIVSLACADLTVAILVMPFHVAYFLSNGRWQLGAHLCNIWLTLDILTCTSSILHLCVIALDRYQAIHDPLGYALKRTYRRVLLQIGLVWLASALISIPPVIGWNKSSGHSLYDDVTQRCELTDEKGFVIFSASGSFFIPFLIMTVVYAKIFIAIRGRLRARSQAAAATIPLTRCPPRSSCSRTATSLTRVPLRGRQDRKRNHGGLYLDVYRPEVISTSGNFEENLEREREAENDGVQTDDVGCHDDDGDSCRMVQSPPAAAAATSSSSIQLHLFMKEKQRISLSKERRAARTMAIIMAAFVLCWLPFFLMYLIFPFCDWCVARSDRRFVQALVWLGYVNSALNPIIYTVFNLDFRTAFANLLLLRKCHDTDDMTRRRRRRRRTTMR